MPGMGVRQMMVNIKQEFPHLAYGYFNPPAEVQSKYNAIRVELGR
jgi:hypothetical protein